ncbi:TraB/GumN family protein [Algoriphagus terrigena]|uniref:TraB/GumN family protein n=1 Tax=Algoriphagus terrigena TaxID=344884 RepID=UPI0003FDF0B5|nr:TraB/GumN family protein [Algoriphagus terrigena]
MSSTFSKKATATLILLISILGASKAQDSSLLWKVSGNGLDSNSYLFGTIHVICKEDFLMDERILRAFDRSEKLVMELDMSDPQLQMKIQEFSVNPGMKNIQSDLPPEEAAIIDSFLLQHYGAGLAQLGVFKPIVLSSMALMKTIPCEEIESYEGFLSTKAIESKKPIIGLETPEFQIGIFDQIPIETQLDELVEMLKEDSGSAEFHKMTETYLAEDIEGLHEVMNSDGMMQEYSELVLDSRNKAWISILEEEMKSQKLFIAVGAGHLGGENGVISLLRNAGYRVEPIKK